MEQLETLKRRIGSVQDLQSVVRTMKSLAAVNIHHFEEAARAVGGYSETVEQGFQILLRSIPLSRIPGPEDRVADSPEDRVADSPEDRVADSPEDRVADSPAQGVIVIGSHHGMCGQFNQQVAGYTARRLDELNIRQGHRRMLALGERVRSRVEESGERVDRVLSMAGSLAEVDAVMHEVLLVIDAWREQEEVERILLFHNAPLSRAAHAPGLTVLFPLDPAWLRKLRERRWPSRRLPTYTIDWRSLLSALTRQVLFVTLYRALVESLAAENASRLAAMRAAEQNIDDRLEELGNEFNRRRQAAITMELLDIISGFEAIESGSR